jgi:hypothetical protein
MLAAVNAYACNHKCHNVQACETEFYPKFQLFVIIP